MDITTNLSFRASTSRDGKRVIFSLSYKYEDNYVTLLETFDYTSFHSMTSDFKRIFIKGIKLKLLEKHPDFIAPLWLN